MRLIAGRTLGGAGLALVTAVCFGCAAARVKNVQRPEEGQVAAKPTPRPKPSRVIVFDFETGGADVRVLSSPRRTASRAVGLSVAAPDVAAEAVANVLSNQLVEQFKSMGFTAERAAGAEPPGVNDLVVQGQFVHINEGSVTKRFVIGFGVGATELRTQVEVFQVTAAGWEPVKQFDTVSQGSRFPGAGFFVAGGAAAGTVVTSAMITSGVGVVREAFASIDADARRTAEQITKKISELSTEHHW